MTLQKNHNCRNLIFSSVLLIFGAILLLGCEGKKLPYTIEIPSGWEQAGEASYNGLHSSDSYTFKKGAGLHIISIQAIDKEHAGGVKFYMDFIWGTDTKEIDSYIEIDGMTIKALEGDTVTSKGEKEKNIIHYFEKESSKNFILIILNGASTSIDSSREVYVKCLKSLSF